MAYLHPDKLVAVDRILLRKKARQGVTKPPKPKTPEQKAAELFSRPKRPPTPRASNLVARLAARL